MHDAPIACPAFIYTTITGKHNSINALQSLPLVRGKKAIASWEEIIAKLGKGLYRVYDLLSSFTKLMWPDRSM